MQAVNQFLVFLVSGLSLKLDELKAATKHWQGACFGLLAILAITPCSAFAARALPLQPPDFATGLAIFSVMPTTLGVGVALTTAAQGNQGEADTPVHWRSSDPIPQSLTALAVLLTVTTNLLAIVVAPAWLKLVLVDQVVGDVNIAQLIGKLMLTVLLPTIVGVVARYCSQRVRALILRHGTSLTIFSHINLALIIWQTLSGAQPILVAQQATSILVIIACGVLQHLIYIAFNALAVWTIQLPAAEAIAVLIMASQKSAPVAVTVIAYITSSQSVQGLLSVPAIIGQLAQIFLGSVLVPVLRRFVKEPQE